MARVSLTAQAQDRIAQRLLPGDVVIDATLGNGHDAVFMAQCVGKQGLVFGFDIQAQAILNSESSLLMLADPPETYCMLCSHAEMLQRIPLAFHGRIKAIMFNLGYLPGGDKSCITQVSSTIRALNAATAILGVGGRVTVMVYPGHLGGDLEATAVEAWVCDLDKSCFSVEKIASQSDKSTAPRLFVIDKRADLL